MKRSLQKAFSLMEVVVSLALMGLVIILVLNIFPSSLFATQSASNQIEAQMLAQSTLEEVRSAPFSGLSAGVTTLSPPDSKYQVTREIFEPAGTDSEQTLGVRIRVRWNVKGRPKELTREVWISSVRS